MVRLVLKPCSKMLYKFYVFQLQYWLVKIFFLQLLMLRRTDARIFEQTLSTKSFLIGIELQKDWNASYTQTCINTHIKEMDQNFVQKINNWKKSFKFSLCLSLFYYTSLPNPPYSLFDSLNSLPHYFTPSLPPSFTHLVLTTLLIHSLLFNYLNF